MQEDKLKFISEIFLVFYLLKADNHHDWSLVHQGKTNIKKLCHGIFYFKWNERKKERLKERKQERMMKRNTECEGTLPSDTDGVSIHRTR